MTWTTRAPVSACDVEAECDCIQGDENCEDEETEDDLGAFDMSHEPSLSDEEEEEDESKDESNAESFFPGIRKVHGWKFDRQALGSGGGG